MTEGAHWAFRATHARGDVDLDALGAHARLNYLRARTTIGRDYALPAVGRPDLH